MKVYVSQYIQPGTKTYLLGVFSTEEKLKENWNKVSRNFGGGYPKLAEVNVDEGQFEETDKFFN